MSRRLSSFCLLFFFFSFISNNASAKDDSVAKYYNQSEYNYDIKYNLCRCHDFHWVNGLQVFGNINFIYSLGAKDIIPLLNQNIYYYDQVRCKKEECNSPIKYYSLLNSNFNYGGEVGIRYMMGTYKNALGIYFSIGKKNLIDLITFSSEIDRNIAQEVKRMRKEQEQKQSSEEDDDNKYKIPEELKFSLWNIDIFLEKMFCYTGDLHRTIDKYRSDYCFLGYAGCGLRINFLEEVENNIYSKRPLDKYSKTNMMRIVPLFKFGFQSLFKLGFFIDVNFCTQLFPTFFNSEYVEEYYVEEYYALLIQSPKANQQYSIMDFAKPFLFLNPQINLSIGYDFYGLCFGEKVEEYYDN